MRARHTKKIRILSESNCVDRERARLAAFFEECSTINTKNYSILQYYHSYRSLQIYCIYIPTLRLSTWEERSMCSNCSATRLHFVALSLVGVCILCHWTRPRCVWHLFSLIACVRGPRASCATIKILITSTIGACKSAYVYSQIAAKSTNALHF